VDRMNRLVTDISNTSRLEAELVRDTWHPVAMDTLLGDLIRHHDLQADAAGVRIILRKQGRDMAVRGLQSRLAQVFANIIGNALSFVPPGGEIAIVIKALDEDSVQVEITDTGPGIPPDNLDDIFKRFYSSRPDAEFGDHSGLGLAISRQIIAAHGGTITAGNRTDGQTGAVFTVVLPR
jgi:two-component system sensor histidine kinase ChvG